MREVRVVEDKIAALKKDEGYDGQISFPWASWLPRIMFNMNTQCHTTTRETPYKLVFGQMPHHAIVPGASTQFINEEEIESIVKTPTLESSTSAVSQSSTIKPPPTESPPSSAKTWIVQKEKIIT